MSFSPTRWFRRVPAGGAGSNYSAPPETRRRCYRRPVPFAEGDGADSRRRFVVACAIGIALSGVVVVWMLTSGTWDFLQANQTGNFYDAQARALFHGAWNVPADIVNQEGIRVGRRTYMYFGPVPAVLRMPILFFTSRFDGRLTEPSMLLAALVALIFASRLSWKVRNLVSASPVSLSEAILTGASIMVLGVGSELLFLASAPSVYHEAEIWAVAFALGAFDAITGFLIRPSTRSIALAGVLSGLCLLTRATVGVGPIAALLVLAVGHLVVSMRRRRTTFSAAPAALGGDRVLSPPGQGADDPDWLGITERGNTRWVALGAAGLIPVGAYTWINEAKFHLFFSVRLEDQVEAHLLPAYMNVLVANGGKQFGLKFLPTDLLQYLRPDALRFSRVFPFITFPPPATVIGHLLYFSRGPASSVTAMMPAIAAAAIVGIFFVFRGRRDGMTDLVVLRVPLIGAALGAVGVLVYLSIVQRAVGDLLPFLVISGIVGFQVLVHRVITMARWTRRILLLGQAQWPCLAFWQPRHCQFCFSARCGPGSRVARAISSLHFKRGSIRRSLGSRSRTSARRTCPHAPDPRAHSSSLGTAPLSTCPTERSGGQ